MDVTDIGLVVDLVHVGKATQKARDRFVVSAIVEEDDAQGVARLAVDAENLVEGLEIGLVACDGFSEELAGAFDLLEIVEDGPDQPLQKTAPIGFLLEGEKLLQEFGIAVVGGPGIHAFDDRLDPGGDPTRWVRSRVPIRILHFTVPLRINLRLHPFGRTDERRV